MCYELESIQSWIAHIIFIMAGNTFSNFHPFDIGKFYTIIRPGMMAFSALKNFLMFFMGKPGRFSCGFGF